MKIIYKTLGDIGIRSQEHWERGIAALHLRRCMTDEERIVPEAAKQSYLSQA